MLVTDNLVIVPYSNSKPGVGFRFARNLVFLKKIMKAIITE